MEHRWEYPNEWAAITSIAQKCGMTAETLRKWVRQTEVDGSRRPGLSSEEAARIKELERENKELRPNFPERFSTRRLRCAEQVG